MLGEAKKKKVYRPTPTLKEFHADNSPVRMVMGPVGCYSGDTEYLTPGGWRRFADGPADLVAQYDPETQTVSFVEPVRWVENARSDFVLLRSGPIEQLVTPDHKVVFWANKGTKIGRADEIHGRGQMITAAYRFVDDRRPVNITPEQLKLQAALLLRATWGSCWSTRLNARLVLDDEEECLRYKTILDDAGVQVVERPGFVLTGRMPWRIDVAPSSWWHLNADQLAALWKAFVDLRMGHDGSFELTTNDRRFVDWLQYAAFVNGWTSYFLREGATYTVFCQRGHGTSFGGFRRIEAQPGPSYCFEVPSGFLVVRYKGRVFVSGNSGKSVGCLTEIFWRAFAMPPGKDGVRRSRALVARRTYPQLKTTTIATFNEWYGELGSMRWDSPITWHMKRPLSDGTICELTIYFMALDGPVQKVADKLKSLELTYAFLNEAAELDGELIPHIISRLRRYPRKDTLPEGVEPYYGVWMDSNPPSTLNWVYQKFEVEKPKGWKMFRQPPALIYDENGELVPNPEAENVENHVGGYEYWLSMASGMTEPQIRSLIMGEYAPPTTGKPVYPAFSAHLHVAKEDLHPHGRIELIVGCDWGLHPAAVVTALMPDGQFVVFDEIVPQEDTILYEEFRDAYLIPTLREKYRNFPVLIVGDPAGMAKSAVWRETVYSDLISRGFAAKPAKTNNVQLRIQAVDHFLRRMNGFVMSPRCVVLREGFEGGYVFKRTSKTAMLFSSEPEKNEFSHVHDALQYAALEFYIDVAQNALARRRRMRPRSTVNRGLGAFV